MLKLPNFLFLIFVFTSFSVLAQVSAPVKSPQIKILFIGNSYLYNNNLPDIEYRLARASGIDVYIDAEIAMGQSVNRHIKAKSTWVKVNSRKWDYVIIQDHQRFYYDTPPSLDSFCFEDKKLYKSPLMDNNLKLQDSIKKLIPGVKIIWFEGWEQSGGVESRFPGDNTVKLLGRMHANFKYLNDQPGAHDIIAPIGDAYASSIIQRPYLQKVSPDRSDLLFDHDGRHPGKAGSFLAACVLFETIFHHPPMDLKPTYNKVPEMDTFLIKTSWQVMNDSFAYTNLASVTPEIRHGWLNKYAFHTAKKYATYQWYSGNTAIAGANKRKYKPETKGLKPSYWVETTDSRGCVYMSFPIKLE